MNRHHSCPISALMFFLFISINNTALAQPGPVISWQKCLGGSGEDKANDILINPDGSFIVAGYSKSSDGDVTGHHGSINTSDGLVAKLDPSGNIIWVRSVGGSNDDVFQTVIATNDNAYLCVGYTNSDDGDVTNAHGLNDAWVVKINASGNILWSKCYGGTKYDVAADAVLTPDGDYAIMGTCYSSDGDVASGVPQKTDADGWAFKIDNNGILIWENCIGVSENVGYNILRSEDNNLYGLVSSLEHYIYNPGPEQMDEIRTPGYLYHIDNTTGAAYITGNLGGDSCYSMCRNADSIFFSYTALTFTYPQSCDIHSIRVGSRANGSSNFNHLIGVSTYQPCDASGTLRQFAHLHGIAADDNSIVCAGRSYYADYGLPYYGFGYDSGNAVIATKFNLPFPNSPQPAFKEYGATGFGTGFGDDAFTSIKVLPTGKEYITAGYTTSNTGDVSGNHGSYDCWIVHLEAANKITGNVFLDANDNGIRDPGELPFNSDIVKTSKVGSTQSGLPYNGIYVNTADTGTYTTTLLLNRPYYTFTPAAKTSVFTTYKNTDTANFAVHAIPGIQDYSLSVVPLTAPRPGFDLQYKIVYNNNGTTTLTSKDITFIKDSRSALIGSAPLYTSVSGDTIRWNITSLPPFAGGSIMLNLQLGVPPVINFGETISSTALIDSAGDNTPVDNYTVITQNVQGSYDPNDKQENFGGEIYPPDITSGKFLTYTIRFQNTGNDTAFNIILRDTIDDKLRGDSLEMVGSSYPCQVSISENKYLKVVFSDIKLVDSLHNEPLSHGYFSYRVKPESTLIIGDSIQNTAYIYFDFNPPIKTNTPLTFVRPVPVNVLWTGAVSTSWEDTNNWSNHLVPDEKTNVAIGSGLARYPVVNSNAVCRSILVKTGASVLVKNGFSIHVEH